KVKSGDDLPFRVILHPAIINRTHHLDGLYESYGYDPLMPRHGVGRLVVPDAASLQDNSRPDWRVPLLERAGVRYDAMQWLPSGMVPEGLLDKGDQVNAATAAQIIKAPGASLFDVSRNVVA